jgi:hypothetical protein
MLAKRPNLKKGIEHLQADVDLRSTAELRATGR